MQYHIEVVISHDMCMYRGVSYINTSMTKEGLPAKFVSEKAPRTAIVVYKNGTLSLMQVLTCVTWRTACEQVHAVPRWMVRRISMRGWTSLS